MSIRIVMWIMTSSPLNPGSSNPTDPRPFLKSTTFQLKGTTADVKFVKTLLAAFWRYRLRTSPKSTKLTKTLEDRKPLRGLKSVFQNSKALTEVGLDPQPKTQRIPNPMSKVVQTLLFANADLDPSKGTTCRFLSPRRERGGGEGCCAACKNAFHP